MSKFFLGLILVCLSACFVKEKSASNPEVKMLTSPAISPSAEPYLFTDQKGTTYLSWIEGTKEKSTLKYSTMSDNKWSKSIAIDSGKSWFVNWADYPMITTNGHEFLAHYLQMNGGNGHAYDIKITSSGDGISWNPAEILHDDGKQAEHGFISLLPYGEKFFVSWLDGRNASMEGMENHEGHHGEMTLRAAVLDKNGNKLNEWELDKRVCDCCQTSAAITDAGPIVVYRDRSEEEVRDISIVRLVDGTWTQPVTIHGDSWKIAGCPVNGPHIEARGMTLAMAWFSSADNKPQVNVIFSRDGGKTFGDPFRIDEGNPIGRVDIVLMDDDHAMVSWMEGPIIKAMIVNRDGSSGEPIIISKSSGSRSSGFPQMSRSNNKMIFAWTDEESKTVKVAAINQ